MPLPCVANRKTSQCTARSRRSGVRCLNPTAFGMPVCRFHGARRSETIKQGTDHPAYKHGQETIEMKAVRSASSSRLRKLEAWMHLLNMTTANRMPGRKPTSPIQKKRS